MNKDALICRQYFGGLKFIILVFVHSNKLKYSQKYQKVSYYGHLPHVAALPLQQPPCLLIDHSDIPGHMGA